MGHIDINLRYSVKELLHFVIDVKFTDRTVIAKGFERLLDLFKDFIDLDEQGFIKVVPGTASTNLPGIFAAGDVADPVYRQGIVAAGSGAKAAIEADRYLQQL